MILAARGQKPTNRGTPPPGDFSDDGPTSIYESGAHKSDDLRAARPDKGQPARATRPDRGQQQPTDPRATKVERPNEKTQVDASPPSDSTEDENGHPAPKVEASQPIVAISMKTPADPRLAPVPKQEREMPHVRLRAMSEVARAQQPQNLGNLAPPYDPREARKRSARELVVWGCLAVMIASGIALVVWFVAT